VSEIQNIRRNRHPADRLADCRQAIAKLETEERSLRSWLLAHPADRCGDSFVATIRGFERRRVDMESLTAEIGSEVVARHTRSRSVDQVHLREVTRTPRRPKERLRPAPAAA
jgi:hypothetical protein